MKKIIRLILTFTMVIAFSTGCSSVGTAIKGVDSYNKYKQSKNETENGNDNNLQDGNLPNENQYNSQEGYCEIPSFDLPGEYVGGSLSSLNDDEYTVVCNIQKSINDFSVIYFDCMQRLSVSENIDDMNRAINDLNEACIILENSVVQTNDFKNVVSQDVVEIINLQNNAFNNMCVNVQLYSDSIYNLDEESLSKCIGDFYFIFDDFNTIINMIGNL